jgi:hypothetical protein
MEVGSKYSAANSEPFGVGRVYVSVAATGTGRRVNLEHEPTLCAVMTLWYASNEKRTSGESRVNGTSLRLDTAAAKLYAEGRERSG